MNDENDYKVSVTERWYGQGDEIGGLHTRTRVDPTCEMSIVGGRCGRPAVERVNQIDLDPHPRYPSDIYWCPEHAALLRQVDTGWLEAQA